MSNRLIRSLFDVTELSSSHLAVIWWFVRPTHAFSKQLHKQCQRELVRRGDLIMKDHAEIAEWQIEEWRLPDEQLAILMNDFDFIDQSLEDTFFEEVMLYDNNPWREAWEEMAVDEYIDELKKKDPLGKGGTS
jgi:hypothetical protein